MLLHMLLRPCVAQVPTGRRGALRRLHCVGCLSAADK